MAKHLTRYTVQEVLNRKSSFEYYRTVTGDDNDWNLSFQQISASTDFLGANPKDYATDDGRNNVSPFVDTSIKWSKVTVDELAGSIDLYIKLNSNDSDMIFIPSGMLPITFTGMDINDMWIKTSAANATIQIAAWR